MRLQLLQLLIDCGKTNRSSVRTLYWPLQGAVLVGQGLQINALLAGGIQGILRSLQLALQALQNLQIGRQLPGHFSHMLPFELTDSVFLVCQIFPCGFQLVLEEFSRIFRLLLAHFKILIDEQIG